MTAFPGPLFRAAVVGVQIASLCCLFTLNGLILCGWGIYHESLGDINIIPIVNVCLNGCIFKKLIAISDHRFWLFFLIPFIVYCTLYLGYNNRAILVAQNLLEEIGRLDLAVEATLLLLIRFGRQLGRLLVVSLIIGCSVATISSFDSTRVLTEELIINFAVAVLDAQYFWITKDHTMPLASAQPYPSPYRLVDIEAPGEENRTGLLGTQE
jgi:hypothetical protein